VYAFAVYLTQYPFLPYQRTAELFDELAGIALSPATRVRAPVQAIGQALVRAAVAPSIPQG
jgi:hypothetical protein